MPYGYNNLGRFIHEETDIDLNKLETGDVLYAENIRNKQGEKVDKSLKSYKDKNEWIYHLHSLIYIGKLNNNSNTNYVWHATYIENGPALWDWSKFLHYYKPVSVKRVI